MSEIKNFFVGRSSNITVTGDVNLLEKRRKVVNENDVEYHNIWLSWRLAFAICAFLAMVLQVILRNTIHIIILFIAPGESSNNLVVGEPECYNNASKSLISVRKTSQIPWTRDEEFQIQCFFYFGCIISMPVVGRLVDRFGCKLFFVNSLTLQAIIFLLIPEFAELGHKYIVTLLAIQGLIAGCGMPAIYKLFVIWAHPKERTALLSLAYGGFSVGGLVVYPLATSLTIFGWEWVFYIIGIAAFCIAFTFNWLVYNTIDEHPYLSDNEYYYLKASTKVASRRTPVPWLHIFSSCPVYIFTITHFLHSYGILMFSSMVPRFLKEAMGYDLKQVGFLSSICSIGCITSKTISFSCGKIEQCQPLTLTSFRRAIYTLCATMCVMAIICIIAANCHQKLFVIVMLFCYGFFSDIGFSGAYWPSLLNFAPSNAGFIAGLANSISTSSAFWSPFVVLSMVPNGSKNQWDQAMMTVFASNSIAGLLYGCFGTSDLQIWDSTYEDNR